VYQVERPTHETSPEQEDSPTIGAIEAFEDQLAWLRSHEVEIGSYGDQDQDGDGEPERCVYLFPKEEVALNIQLERALDLRRDPAGTFNGRLILQFENEGGPPGVYDHVEDIPKEMARHVDDLAFSIQPDAVLEEDPKVFWKNLGTRLADERERVALVATFVTHGDPLYEMAARAEFAEWVVPYLTRKCSKEPPGRRDLCLIELLAEIQNTDFFERRSAAAICRDIELPVFRVACRSLLEDDREMCVRMMAEPEERDMCLGLSIEAYCSRRPEDVQDDCRMRLATQHRSKLACYAIQNTVAREACLAGIVREQKTRPSGGYTIADWFPENTMEQTCRSLLSLLSGFTHDGTYYQERSTEPPAVYVDEIRCSYDDPDPYDFYRLSWTIRVYSDDERAAEHGENLRDPSARPPDASFVGPMTQYTPGRHILHQRHPHPEGGYEQLEVNTLFLNTWVTILETRPMGSKLRALDVERRLIEMIDQRR
jgi:hypothetical protein